MNFGSYQIYPLDSTMISLLFQLTNTVTFVSSIIVQNCNQVISPQMHWNSSTNDTGQENKATVHHSLENTNHC